MPNDPTHLAAWIAAATFLVAAVNQVLKLTDRFRSHPPAAELQMTSDELQRRIQLLELEVPEVRRRHDESFEREQREASERRKAIYHKIETSAQETRALLQQTSRQLQEDISGVHKRVDQILEFIAKERKRA